MAQRSSCDLCCTRIENLSVVRGGKTVLNDINLHLHCGELTAIIGPNGAGKTTLLKAILGELKHEGELNYVGVHQGNKVKPVIGYVPQRLDFDPGSPVSVLDLFAISLGKKPAWLCIPRDVRENAHTSLARVKAEHLIDRRLGSLSGGELQRVLLALALNPLPDILLMDEPVSGVDPMGMAIFYQMVSDLRNTYDMAIIMVSHDLGMVRRYADHVVYLNRRVLKEGTPAEVLADTLLGEVGETDGMPKPYDYQWALERRG